MVWSTNFVPVPALDLLGVGLFTVLFVAASAGVLRVWQLASNFHCCSPWGPSPSPGSQRSSRFRIRS